MRSMHKHDVLLSILDRISAETRDAQQSRAQEVRGCCPTCLYRFDPLLDRYEASAFTGFKPGTLAVWDSTKAYDLEPIKFGNAVRYRLSSLNRFADERIRPSRR